MPQDSCPERDTLSKAVAAAVTKTYRAKGKYDMAIEQFREAIRLNPKLVSASVFLGIDYYLTSRTDLAIPPRSTPNCRRWIPRLRGRFTFDIALRLRLRRASTLRPSSIVLLTGSIRCCLS